MTTEELKDYIARLRKERGELLRKYQGVRPSWVSTDVAILGERIDRFVAKVKEMEGETDD